MRSLYRQDELERLSKLSPRDLIQRLQGETGDLEKLLEEEMRPDRISLILNIFSNISRPNRSDVISNIALLTMFVNSNFWVSTLK